MIHKLPFSLRRQELSLKRKLFAYMFLLAVLLLFALSSGFLQHLTILYAFSS